MVNYVLAFDPGRSTGIALLSYEDDSPARLVKAWQFSGGASRLTEWVEAYFLGGVAWFFPDLGYIEPAVIAEKYVPLPGRGFSHTLDSTYPLVCEGALIALGVMPEYDKVVKVWQRASAQYRQGGPTTAEKRKRSKQFLRDIGMYVTGKGLGAPDNEDAVSAILHALTYITTVVKHRPTFETYYEKD